MPPVRLSNLSLWFHHPNEGPALWSDTPQSQIYARLNPHWQTTQFPFLILVLVHNKWEELARPGKTCISHSPFEIHSPIGSLKFVKWETMMGGRFGGLWHMLAEIEIDLKCCNRSITRPFRPSPLRLSLRYVIFPRLSHSFSSYTTFFFYLSQREITKCSRQDSLVIFSWKSVDWKSRGLLKELENIKKEQD